MSFFFSPASSMLRPRGEADLAGEEEEEVVVAGAVSALDELEDVDADEELDGCGSA